MNTTICLMSFGKVQESTEAAEFKKYIGIAGCKIVAFNPSKEELSKLYGRDITKDPEYYGVMNDNDGKEIQMAYPTFILKSDPETNNDIEEFFQWFDEVYKLNSKYENGVVFEPTPQDCYSYFDKKGIHINVQTAMMLCQVQKSFTNTKAAEFVRDTMGQKPVATAEVNVNLEARKELAELAKLLDE